MLGTCWPILASIWASPEPMLNLGWAKLGQVEPMLVDLVLKRRSVEAISADVQPTTRVPKRAFNINKTTFL